MTISKTLFLGVAVLSLCACQTAAVIPSPSEALLAGIDTSTDLPSGLTKSLSGSDPTCLAFYKNVTSFASLPADMNVDVPSTPSLGGSLLRTVVLGTLAGVAGGGVSALGIGSNFLQSAAVGTASQVTYNAGGTVYDKIVKPKTPELEVPAIDDVPSLSPLQEIQKAASSLGCPSPDASSIASLDL